MADTLKKAVRTGDIVARVGGEEFAVYLPGCPYAEAMAVAERIRERIGVLSVSTEAGDEIRFAA